jgi:dimethylaniline monooxygenase (N-oxide forming)
MLGSMGSDDTGTDSTEAGAPGEALPPADEVTVTIAAPAEQLWDMVADITRMGEWSPECYRCRWIGRERRPVAGARFLGFNKKGLLRWMTPNVVREAERGRVFSFRTVGNNNIWGYRFDPDDASGNGAVTKVTEFRQLPAKRPWWAKPALALLGGAKAYDAGVPDGMRATLERLKAAAEA